jgi:hypothetical protein
VGRRDVAACRLAHRADAVPAGVESGCRCRRRTGCCRLDGAQQELARPAGVGPVRASQLRDLRGPGQPGQPELRALRALRLQGQPELPAPQRQEREPVRALPVPVLPGRVPPARPGQQPRPSSRAPSWRPPRGVLRWGTPHAACERPAPQLWRRRS